MTEEADVVVDVQATTAERTVLDEPTFYRGKEGEGLVKFFKKEELEDSHLTRMYGTWVKTKKSKKKAENTAEEKPPEDDGKAAEPAPED